MGGVGENREECDKVGHVIGTTDLDICDEHEFPSHLSWSKLCALNAAVERHLFDVGGCLYVVPVLVPNRPAAAADHHESNSPCPSPKTSRYLFLNFLFFVCFFFFFFFYFFFFFCVFSFFFCFFFFFFCFIVFLFGFFYFFFFLFFFVCL